MHPDHQRALAAVRVRRPDIEIQAILALRLRHFDFKRSVGYQEKELRRDRAKGRCVAYPRPGVWRLWRLEAALSNRRRRVRDAFPRDDPAEVRAPDFSRGRFNNGRPVVVLSRQEYTDRPYEPIYGISDSVLRDAAQTTR